MSRFLLLHASDLHLSQVPDPLGLAERFGGELPAHFAGHDPAPIKGLARYAALHRAELDAVLLGGDISASGSEGDLRRAYDFCVAPAGTVPWLSERGHPTLGPFAAEDRLFVLPGNHDRYEHVVERPVGGRAFDRLFANFWQVGQGAQLYPALVREGKALQVVGLDLTLQSPGDATVEGGAWGQGRCYQEVLSTARHLGDLARRELVRRGEVAAGSDVAILWLVHFAPLFPRLKRSLELVEGDLLVYEAARAGAVALLAGHTHLVQHYEARTATGQAVPVFCSGTAGLEEARQDTACQLVEVDFDRAGSPHAAARILRWSSEKADWIA